LLGALVLIVIPALITLGLAFFRYDALKPPVWVGRQNFTLVYYEAMLWRSLNNSLFFVILAVPLRLLGALGLALLLKRPRPGVGLYRALVYLPTIVPDVAYALVWLWIFNPFYGPLNLILEALHLPTMAWLVNPQTAKPALVFMALFQIGEGFIILLAGLKGINPNLYEAAQVDGASRWQRFWLITMPLLSPWLVLLSVRDITLSFQNTFTPAYIMTGGGPYYATFFLPLLIFEEAFDRWRFGQGAVITWWMLLLTIGLLALTFWLAGGWGYDE
jgi:multiple sugar transport system permease protein